MATYLKGKSDPITRQEGDTADIEVSIPDILNCIEATLQFKVVRYGVTIISKTISMTSQTATIPLNPLDTKGYAGVHEYEIEITTVDGKIVTVARNKFIIDSELIK